MEFFNFHTHQFTNQPNILELVNQYPNEFDISVPFYSIGIHPWYIKEDQIDVDLKIVEVGLWEPSYDTELWLKKKQLHLFVQKTGQGDGEKTENLPAQMVKIVKVKLFN